MVYVNTSICQISVYEFVRSALKGHALTVCEACKLRAIEIVIDLLVQVLLQKVHIRKWVGSSCAAGSIMKCNLLLNVPQALVFYYHMT